MPIYDNIQCNTIPIVLHWILIFTLKEEHLSIFLFVLFFLFFCEIKEKEKIPKERENPRPFPMP